MDLNEAYQGDKDFWFLCYHGRIPDYWISKDKYHTTTGSFTHTHTHLTHTHTHTRINIQIMVEQLYNMMTTLLGHIDLQNI